MTVNPVFTHIYLNLNFGDIDSNFESEMPNNSILIDLCHFRWNIKSLLQFYHNLQSGEKSVVSHSFSE